jgi:hypothetical protein
MSQASITGDSSHSINSNHIPSMSDDHPRIQTNNPTPTTPITIPNCFNTGFTATSTPTLLPHTKLAIGEKIE